MGGRVKKREIKILQNEVNFMCSVHYTLLYRYVYKHNEIIINILIMNFKGFRKVFSYVHLFNPRPTLI